MEIWISAINGLQSYFWFHLRRPWGIVIGLVCQFGLMPLIAYLLALGFSVQPTQAVAILIMGCCPGGVISNIITLWVDGDMDLSLSMTSCSTILAVGMMPLCLFIYSRSWELAKSIKIPYYNIGMALLSVVVPVGVGVYVNYKWPKKAKIISKAGSIIGGLLMLVIGVASSVLYKGSWNTDISILTIGIIYPLLGYISGFGMAVIVRQPWQRCRTIALETGAQNVQMCSTVLQLSFTPKQLVQMFTFPLIYASFQFLNGMLLVAAYQIYKRRYGAATKEKSVNYSERSIKVNDLPIKGNINMNFEYNEEGATHNVKEITSNVISNTTDQLSEMPPISKDTFL
ncbi:sodium-dependent organic anion transporter [Rhinophrynus dorsalis]